MKPDKNVLLPDTLHELLDVAIIDASRLDRDLYTPFCMLYHHKPREDGPCLVCLAGVVIAGTLAASRDRSLRRLSPSDYDGDTIKKLRTLDLLRTGNYLVASQEFYGYKLDIGTLPQPDSPTFTSWPEFDRHVQSLRHIQQELERMGV